MLRLKEILLQKHMSQVELAKIMGVTTVTVNHWVKNKAMPSVESLIKIGEILDVGLDDLVISSSRNKKYPQPNF